MSPKKILKIINPNPANFNTHFDTLLCRVVWIIGSVYENI